MSRASDRLREFHEAFDVEPNIAQRITLHTEEAGELRDALAALWAFEDRLDAHEREHERDWHRERRAELHRHVARELADEMVVLFGTADLFGIDLDVAFEAVMDANMAKLPDCKLCTGKGYARQSGGPFTEPCGGCGGTGKGKPIKDPSTGKVLKPDGWQEPDLSGAVGRSGGSPGVKAPATKGGPPERPAPFSDRERNALARAAPGIEEWTLDTMKTAHLTPFELARAAFRAGQEHMLTGKRGP